MSSNAAHDCPPSVSGLPEMSPPPVRKLLTHEQAAERLGIEPAAMAALIRCGIIPPGRRNPAGVRRHDIERVRRVLASDSRAGPPKS